MKISVAIATYNGDSLQIIKTCLDSVYSWVDEIVIVYGSPKDDSIKKITEYDRENKVKLIFSDNPPLFHLNKQKAIDACTGEWILQLDTDEVVSEELKKEIIDTIHKNPEENGFWMPRLNYFLGHPLTKGGQYPDYTLRLYKNEKGKLPCKSIHEQAEVTGKTGYLHHNLLHYPWPTIEEYIQKGLVRYSVLEAGLLYKNGVRPSLWNAYKYFKLLPLSWCFKTYFRHRGYVDGFPGFVFSAFSSLRYWIIYVKLIELTRNAKKT